MTLQERTDYIRQFLVSNGYTFITCPGHYWSDTTFVVTRRGNTWFTPPVSIDTSTAILCKDGLFTWTI